MRESPVHVARAALMEVGRIDIADRVEANRAGWPSVLHTPDDHDLIAKAFWLAHVSTGHAARLTRGLDGELGISCRDCGH